MFASKKFFSNLNGMLNFVWYTGIAVSVIVFIATAVFLFASLSGSNLETPAVSFRAGNFSYRFNTKYLELMNLETISNQYREAQMGSLLTVDTWEKKCYESLYNVKFPPSRQSDIRQGNPVYYVFTSDIPWNFSGIFVLKNVPMFPVAFSLLVLSFLFFGMIILFNVREILSFNSSMNLFSAKCSLHIKYIGSFILLSEAIRVLLLFFINSSMVNKFYFSELWYNKIITTNGSYCFSWTDVNYGIVFIGLVILLLSKIIKTGALLKEDVDLTI